MKLTFTGSFERSLKKSPERERAEKAIESLVKALEGNQKPKGLGIKKLDSTIWEMRAGLRTRILFALSPGEIKLLLVGDHNEIKRYLRG